jgi:CubicO group peptidase (beta-lactamase class C family)
MTPTHHPRLTRRAAVGTGIAGLAAIRPVVTRARQATPATSPTPDPAEIVAIAEDAMAELHLRAVLLRVTIDDEEFVTHALGESMTGVPATPDMHVRNGAVAITYISTALLRLVDAGLLALDDTIDAWLPDLPDADRVTLRMLANMTAGYPDYVPNAAFTRQAYADPFRSWEPEELIAFSLATPRLFAPGENWDYSHAGYVILGLALEAATGEPLELLLKELVLDQLGLANTGSEQTAWMPEPVLHAYSAERRGPLGIAPLTPFIEGSTTWNPSWTLPRGAVQYSTVTDMATSFAAIGRGDLLSPESHRALVSDELLGFGAPLAGCHACHTLDERYNYGLGIVRSGGWLLQNPLFFGYAGTAACHPGASIAIAVATTYREEAFDDEGGYRNASTTIARRMSELLMPVDPLLQG